MMVGVIPTRLFLVVVGLTLSMGSWLAAEPLDDACIWAYFRASYHEDYVCTECPANALKFLGRVQADHKDLSQFKVIFFKDKVVPRQYRTPKTAQGWEWHVVVLANNRIFDMDYSVFRGKSEPSAIPVSTYVSYNFGPATDGVFPGGEKIADVRVRVVDAQFFADRWNAPVTSDGPLKQTKKVDSDYMMYSDLGNNAQDYTLEEFLKLHPAPLSATHGH